MATKFIENSNNGLLGLWEITETTEQLLSRYIFQNEELDHFLLFRNDLRKREWLATRLLLQEMLGAESIIRYDPAGKPHLVNSNGYISISHSSNHVVIYYHPEHQPGIDIERLARNVEHAARRFLSPDELRDCMVNGHLANNELMLRWCTKEAVFKMVPYADVDFASQIACKGKPFTTGSGEISATFTATEVKLSITLQFRLFREMLIVWGTL